jgi:phosphatidylserine decarboxylase
MSRLYGALNAYTLPVWFRVPGYKLYAYIFGVNLTECEPEDLREYRSMSEFFMRKLKDGMRPVADVALVSSSPRSKISSTEDPLQVSPADGRVVNFGTVEGGRVEQVKGSTYSLAALLSGTGQVDPNAPPRNPPTAHVPHPQNTDHSTVDEAEFANVNGIAYSLNELLGPDGEAKTTDASLDAKQQAEDPTRILSHDAKVAIETAASSMPWAGGQVPKEGNKLFFAVVYLAPGDYHRFHSPTNWIVERRRHFAGELFSVSPWMANKLQDLFVLNERVALLGRWRHGFFSMVPVGATNVGSIRVNFDSVRASPTFSRSGTDGVFDSPCALTLPSDPSRPEPSLRQLTPRPRHSSTDSPCRLETKSVDSGSGVPSSSSLRRPRTSSSTSRLDRRSRSENSLGISLLRRRGTREADGGGEDRSFFVII